MPAHLKNRAGIFYIVDGRRRFSTKTKNEEHASALLERYCRDRLGISSRLRFDEKAKAIIKQFGKPDHQSSIKKLRFPCVYAFVRSGAIIYIGSSVNGFARVLASHHPMVTRAEDSDEILFWVTANDLDAREMEIKMIKTIKPKFNLNSNGVTKASGFRQRATDFPGLKKLIKEAVREEIKSYFHSGLANHR